MLTDLLWILGLLSLLFWSLFIWQLTRRRAFSACRSALLGILFTGLTALLSWTLWSFSLLDNLTNQTPVATLITQPLSNSQVQITLERPQQSNLIVTFSGDDWILGAHVLIWKPWVQALGIRNKYQLDFLGVHDDTSLSQVQTIQLSQTSGENYLDRHAIRWIAALTPFLVDTQDGSAVYMPLRESARYHIFMGASGLIAKQEGLS